MAQKPIVLAIETSSRIGSVAIATGEKILAETIFSGPMRHSVEIFPVIDNLLGSFSRKPKQIEQIYISIGPGSFTGLRIAATIAKAMHLANAAKIVAVNTLDVIAANVISLTVEKTVWASSHESQPTSQETIATVLDAKRGQFFIAIYKRNTSEGIWKKLLPDSLMTASQFLAQFSCKEEPIRLLGDGLLYYKDKFKADGVRFFDEKYWSPRAKKVHLLGWKMASAGQFADPLTLTPNYLRRPQAEVKSNQHKNT